MYLVKVKVMYKESVLDPQGEAVKDAIDQLGYTGVESVRIGKYFELMIDKNVENIDEMVESLCDQLLVNVVMESYTYEVQEVVA